MLSPRYDKYLSTRGIKGPWRIAGEPGTGFLGAVVIPALAESPRLFRTLLSLAANPADLLPRFLVLVVVNHREDASAEDKADNRETLAMLAASARDLAPLRLAWVDAASPGLELPEKKGGVGLARKIGFDLALPLLDPAAPDPLLVALDADTLVQTDYLEALAGHFRSHGEGGAVVPFRHQDGECAGEREAITRYELFLRSYVMGLSLAGSPYAFHTVGSAMACTTKAYVAIGGMNCRVAAEDFYFLQQLKKTSGVTRVVGTTIHPSARPSHRVPFGTGRSVSRHLSGDVEAVRFYHADCFRMLGDWLSLVEDRLAADGDAIGHAAAGISPSLRDFLHQAGFPRTWDRLARNAAGRPALKTAFHGWFDGLKTMKLVHHLSNALFPRGNPESCLPPLLRWAGFDPPTDPKRQLELLRSVQQS